jgi:hypothetical protein
MANTLKFGTDGNWATKEGSTLAYNSENGNFKPLPFNFERSTGATRVNKDGLIEVVSNNEPRIDFTNDSKGALLLEPSRSNLVTYSEDFSQGYWTKARVNISENQFISPSGIQNANKLIENTDNNSHLLYQTSSVSAQDYTSSIFVRENGRKKIRLRFDNASFLRYAEFDLNLGIVLNETNSTANIESYGNGWYRCSIKVTATATTFYNVVQLLSDDGNLNYQGNGTSGIYIYGAQLEQGSYATSYIPTQGSAVTRVQDVCSQTPPSGIIGQTEGSVYVEGNAILDANGSMPFTIYLNSSNILYVWFRTSGIIDIDVFADGSLQDRIRTSVGTISNGDYFKLSLGYKANDLVAYLNGVQIGTANPSLIPSCSSLIIGGYIAADYTGSLINEAKLYNTRLSNAELQALTS